MEDLTLKLERLRKERIQVRRGFTRCYNILSDQLNAEEHEDVGNSFKKLEDKTERLFILDNQVSDLIFSLIDDDKALESEFNEVENYREKWIVIKSKYELFNNSETGSDIAQSLDVASNLNSSISRSKQLYYLPKLNLTKFDGSLKQYIGFWAQFKKIHEDESIDNETKFQYLIQSTVEKSPARELVNSFPPSSSNYTKVIEQFSHRFGRKELLIELYVRELLSLVLSQSTGKTVVLRYLYDQLESQLRSLETLGVTSDMYACMLFPLAESALPEPTLREWHRQQSSRQSLVVEISSGNDNSQPQKHKLEELLAFLRMEVEAEERLSLAQSTFSKSDSKLNSVEYFKNEKVNIGNQNWSNRNKKTLGLSSSSNTPPCTAAGLVNLKNDSKSKPICIFCEGSHYSADCLKARNLSLSDRKTKLSEKRGCFACGKIGHSRKQCKAFLKCIVCNGHHIPILCPKLDDDKKPLEFSKIEPTQNINKEVSLHSNIANTKIFLQTLRVKLVGEKGITTVRALIDTGCQRTYIKKSVAKKQNYTSLETVTMSHSLFGGGMTSTENHDCYLVRLKSTNDMFCCNFKALDQEIICNSIPAVKNGPWTQELEEIGVKVNDFIEGPIDILIGADIAGKLFTGQKRDLKCGLVAIETSLGWTLMGKMNKPEFTRPPKNSSMLVSSMLSLDIPNPISQLWDLDVIGIKDPIEVENKKELSNAIQDRFLEGLKINNDGRYEVELPWIVNHPHLPSNFLSANQRLNSTLKKLEDKGAVITYDKVFDEWKQSGIIEEVLTNEQNKGHYLPHRPVFKDKGTTKIRPVFDGSACEKGYPSINQCLEKGINLLEEIPPLLIRFRLNKIGVISDIEKAFLQISLSEKDRDYLKFLWIDMGCNLKIYRHARVVFGISSSPFLLNAVIDYHLKKCKELTVDKNYPCSELVINKLLSSFYVDNCVTSVNNKEELQRFIDEATFVFNQACFNLRGWEFTQTDLLDDTYSNVLGMTWNRKNDSLKINLDSINKVSITTVTRRVILSIGQRIFDVIGFTAPVSLYPKLLLQQTWIEKGGWDQEVNEEIKNKFLSWFETVHLLEEVEVPRWVLTRQSFILTLHTFCDASQLAYASAVYLRIETANEVFVRLVQAKARVSPIKRATIPRLELLATLIGARLTHFVLQEIKDVQQTFLWSDSTTALTWIKQEEQWGVFVNNRVKEIRELTNKDDWNHVPGVYNPADLPSRGCSPKQLIESKWWEGPSWLKLNSCDWPVSKVEPIQEDIESERKKSSLVTVNISIPTDLKFGEHLGNRYSDYFKIVRIVAWILRLKKNCVNKSNLKSVFLSVEEFKNAETNIMKMIQNEAFNGLQSNKLQTFLDNKGVIRLKTKISERPDLEAFRTPVVLPSNHKLVERLIFSLHVKNGHVGTQSLLNIIRESFWLLKGRQTIKRVTNACVVCRRTKGKSLDACSPPLPEARVRDAVCFEVSGVDFAGPLFLRDGTKAWICLFSCAVYRALHLELVHSLTTKCFILALRRFIARRGRPSIMYSDQGKTFKGLDNAMNRLDWNEIVKFTLMDRIEWRFNPPSSPWWGGFWERLVGIVKQCLKKMLGKAVLNGEELTSILCDCESLINNRPITYMTEDNLECTAITPMMFIQDIKDCRVIDLDKLDSKIFERRLRYVKRVREDLRKRFRIEYLGQLKLLAGKSSRSPKVGEVVLIGADNSKRQTWPLGVIKNIFPGRDGISRVVRLKTASGVLDRPIQRIYPLEVFSENEEGNIAKKEQPLNKIQTDFGTIEEKVDKLSKVTRCGRKISQPLRLISQ